MNKKGSQHMTAKDRVFIEQALKLNMKCKEIAKNIDVDERTVSKEIQKRRRCENNLKYGKGDFHKMDNEPCKTISKYPFVCNGCKRKGYCFKEYKYFYDSKEAQENYETILSDSRSGLDITLNDKVAFDNILKDGMDKGQSINHIVEANKNMIRYSKSSVYRLVNTNQTTIQRLDLRRAVKLRPRKHYVPKEDAKEIRNGRKYADFLKYVANNPFTTITEMDTVESTRSGINKCLLTLHITNTHFMLIYLLESKTKLEVARVFNELKHMLGIDLYKKVFGTILTDRGSEFCDPLSIELDPATGEKIANVYFCNSYSSYQKGAIEENHTLIRYILPKGSSFNHLSQDDVNLIASHINSYYRESIDSTPYELTKLVFGDDFMQKQMTRLIEPHLVMLKPNLIK